MAQLPEIPVKSVSVDGAYAVLVIEHLADHETFFSEAARVVRSGGVLVVLTNRPVWTAPDSSPITDTDHRSPIPMEKRPHHEFDDQIGIPRLLACRWRPKT